MKKSKMALGIFAMFVASTSFGSEYICESADLTSPAHDGASLEFSDQRGHLAKPVVFTYAGQSHAFNIPVQSQMTCKNDELGEWECGGSNRAPVSDVNYSAIKVVDNKIEFSFELYWTIDPQNSVSANYASVVPHFLGIHESIVLKCRQISP